MTLKDRKICVVGLGYVGLPLAIEFSKKELPVTGFDVDSEKIEKLKAGIDPTGEVGSQAIKESKIKFSKEESDIAQTNFIIVAVPTPVDENKQPDLSLVEKASETVGKNLKPGSIVVYESTVYPGVTQEVCLPILERNSNLKAGKDFKIGYSPERINPGDKNHTIKNVIKVVSGQDPESLEEIAEVYKLICQGGVYKAQSIKVAEATKITENIQRDLNIALMNELAKVFSKMDIDTQAVIDAASTKWNFHNYYPGLVGGHCIGVDPYYFLLKAKELGVNPEMTIASRQVNESMAQFVADQVITQLSNVKGAKILVLGLSFKEDINDYRNSKAKDVIAAFKKVGADVIACDPMIDDNKATIFFGAPIVDLKQANGLAAVVYLVAHKKFANLHLEDLAVKCIANPVLFDLRRVYNNIEAQKLGFKYLTL